MTHFAFREKAATLWRKSSSRTQAGSASKDDGTDQQRSAATRTKRVRALADSLKNEGIELAYTGHCTGERAFRILQEELGEDVIKATKSGLRIELDE